MGTKKRKHEQRERSPGGRSAITGARAPGRGARAAAGGALVLAVFLVFGQVGSHDFVLYDDHEYIVDRTRIHDGLSVENVGWALTSTEFYNWHPLTWISMMVDIELFGLDAGKHHLVSVLLHAIAAWILLCALFRLTGAYWPSVLAAALFALHPLRVESVAWASERKDVLSGLFFAWTLLAYAGYGRRGGAARYTGVALLFAAALMSKPMVVTLPFVLLLLDVWPLGRWRPAGIRAPESGEGPPAVPLSRLLLEKAPLFALAAATAAITVVSQAGGGAVRALDEIPLAARIANAAVAAVAYLVDTVWPVGLAPFYPHPAVVDPDASLVVPGLLAGVGLTVATAGAWILSRRRPYVGVGWLWYLGTLVPVIGIVQVGVQSRADRYTYIPLIGIGLGIAFGLRDLVRARPALLRPVLAGSAAALLALGTLAFLQARHWKNTETLFEHTLRVTDDNYLAHYNLGVHLGERGEHAAAVEHLEEAVRIKPDHTKAHISLGAALDALGKTDAAGERFEEAIRLDPRNALAHRNLGNVRARQRRFEEAIASYEEALRLEPGSAVTHERLATVHAARGDLARAIEHLRHAVQGISPPVTAAHNLARLLATASEASLRDGSEAVRLAEYAARATGFRRPQHLATLAAAHAENGDFEAAVRWQEKAIEQAPDAARAGLRTVLEAYRRGQPLRASASPPR